MLVPSVSRAAKYILASGTPEEISPPKERRTFNTDSSHSYCNHLNLIFSKIIRTCGSGDGNAIVGDALPLFDMFS